MALRHDNFRWVADDQATLVIRSADRGKWYEGLVVHLGDTSWIQPLDQSSIEAPRGGITVAIRWMGIPPGRLNDWQRHVLHSIQFVAEQY